MPDTEHTSASGYSAFISYSHRDADFARRLQRALESYSLPRRLTVDLATLRPGTRRLRPVFRDRDELPAAADLTGAVRAALIELAAPPWAQAPSAPAVR
jgi:hypothetical protein